MRVLTTHGFPEESFTAVPDGANLAGDHLQNAADQRTGENMRQKFSCSRSQTGRSNQVAGSICFA